MGGRKQHSWRQGKDIQDSGASRRRTPLDSDTDMFGSPSLWCKKKKTHHHHREAKGRRSEKGVGLDEQPRQKHRILHSPFARLFRRTSGHRHRKKTTPTRETRTGHRHGLGCSTAPPPPPPPPLKLSSPYTTPKEYRRSRSDIQITPSTRSFRRTPYRTPTSRIQESSDFSASNTPSMIASSGTPCPSSSSSSSIPLNNATCESCSKTHHLNATLRRSLLAYTRDMYTILQRWSDDVGCGEGTQGFVTDLMEWQPEKAAVVIEKERRPSEMCRLLMKMGSVEDWVVVMRGLEEKEGGGLGAQRMEGVKNGGGEEGSGPWAAIGNESRGGSGSGRWSGYRRMAVDKGGGQG
ncbi:hypothetical protein NEUTE1DRAFT_144607 [Neurospora tetrasperma FGSC 2508]|uniref:Uncharacterized protein n=1 Tax=Neurospora tetrasperma (strain FGSC 2508 / ATCC MYA-4615 / P0657) TaxID=510951 RepID=F8MD68_NEUT8|nr:uncharacterized protein NEUTE1DRAFT_144607 [Neurospora tetrasperma FGSC 2508]EGO61413.1 hypothetical protein NEUTE1DRAFT_144607 [Neurospora tetrasperma FGSC 2508]EGZ74559.1 hypothetical protein NEUTE2DRAFT_155225 [Neurospora tetrasperma FGSC 2509]